MLPIKRHNSYYTSCNNYRGEVESEKLKLKGLGNKELIDFIMNSTDESSSLKRLAACELIKEKGKSEDIPMLREIAEDMSLRNRRSETSKYATKRWTLDGKRIYLSIPDPDIDLSFCIEEAIVLITSKKECKGKNRVSCWIEMLNNGKKEDDKILISGSLHLIENAVFNKEELNKIASLDRGNDDLIDYLVIKVAEKNPNIVLSGRLIEIIYDQKWFLKVGALRAIEKIGDRSAIPHLKKLLENKNEHEKVRKAAEEAIKKLEEVKK